MKNAQFKVDDVLGDTLNEDHLSLERITKFNTF